MQYETRPKDHDPDIGTAWLVLSHGAFLTASVGASALAVSLMLFVFETTHERRLNCALRALAIGWNAASFLISAWTVFAISQTWRAALRYREQIFGNFGFASLTFVAIALAAVNAWSCGMAATYSRRERIDHSVQRSQQRRA
jgi:hypothetical protein